MREKELEKEFKALANRRRILILAYLSKHPGASVGDISDDINLSFKSTSRHLAVLAHAGMIEKIPDGLAVRHKLAEKKNPFVAAILNQL